MIRLSLGVLGAVVFILLATANSGGYRYGVSDQAYYLPAIERHLDDDLFPRDGALLDAQSKLMTVDDLMAGIVALTGASLPTVALVSYVIALTVCFAAALAFARGLRFSWWTTAAFLLLLTLRHRITSTGANSLEGYMHPRLLAFGLGVAALASLLRDRSTLAAVFVLAAGLLHPTTALWFALLLLAGSAMRHHAARWRTLGALGLLGAAALWAVTAGPLADRLIAMDPQWLTVLAGKDYLFPSDWSLDAWLINLGYPILIVATWRARETRGESVPAEAALAWGAVGLALLFLISIVPVEMGLALAVQLQISRVFWLLDFLALACLAWWITRTRASAIAALVILCAGSAARGYYLLVHYQPERQLVSVTLPDNAWTDAMAWLREQPADWHVLADPGHAWKYGSSVRVAAAKDTVLESVKDSAIALYDPAIAERVAERTSDLADYDLLTTARARELDMRYGVDVVVTEATHTLDLPVLYRNRQFVIYDLR